LATHDKWIAREAREKLLRILEIGEFSLFKRSMPRETTYICTNANRGAANDLDHTNFGPGLLPGLLRSLRNREWDVVVCFPPARPLFDSRRGVAGLFVALYRILFRFRTLGTYAAQWRSPVPLVIVDYNDMPMVPRSALKLLDRSVAYFKRELPLDPGKALFDVAPAFRTHKRLMASKYFLRNIDKLRPISLALSEETIRLAPATPPEKSVDIFFAGAVNHSVVRQRGYAQLQALARAGYAVDICPGGLSRSEYLARCARAWLTWSPEGFGWECFRHYEASLCLSVPVISPPNVTRYRPLLDGVHALMYPVEGDGLREVVAKALQDKSRLARMAQDARAHVLSYHTTDRICEYVLDSALHSANAPGP
jgi:hypothetical protein